MHSQSSQHLCNPKFQHRCPKMLIQTIVSAGITIGLVCSPSFNANAQFRPDRPDFFDLGQEQLEQEIELLQQEQPDTIPVLDVDVDMIQWSAIVLREGDAVVWMPQGMTSHETKIVESIDGNIEFDVISTTSALGRFVVAFSDAEASFTNADPDDLLNRVQTRIIGDQTGFGVADIRTITVDDLPGREFTLQNEEEVIYFRVLLIDGQLYVLAVSQPQDSENEEEITTFFESFQAL